MPITGAQLEAGDILFKHASKGAISQAIAKGQKPHYQFTSAQTGPSPMGQAAAVDITHVAMAVGPNDVLEFDEGGASKAQIVFSKGHGFVRGAVTLASRLGNRYEVFKCTTPTLAKSAVDKAELIWDITHQGPTTGSYGLKKMLKTALLHQKGPAMSTSSFEGQLDSWLKSTEPGGFFKKKPNIQFFCSEFVTFCYLWAASESQVGQLFGVNYVLGVKTARISPVELYTRVETVGKAHFSFRGTLYPA